MKRSSPKPKAAPTFSSRAILPILWAPLLFLFCFGLYLRTLCPTFMDDDSPETIASGVTLGLAHPPSYAWTTLWVRLLSFLPLGTPAFAVNIGSALLAASTALLFAFNILFVLDHFLKKTSTGPRWIKVACAVAGALLLAFSHTYWEKALGAKGGIYLWQMCIAQTILYAYLRFESAPDPFRWLCLTLLLFGLGFTNHWQTQVIFLPILVLMALKFPVKGGSGMIALSFFITGASVLLYLPLRSNLHPGWNLGAPDNWGRFLDSFFRRYVDDRETGLGGLLFQVLQGHKNWADLGNLIHRILTLQGAALGPHMVRDLTLPALLFIPLGLALPWSPSGKRALWAVLLPAGLLILLFLSYFWVPVNIPYHWYIDNFLLPLNVAGAFLAALGLYRLSFLVSDHRPIPLLALACLLFWAAWRFGSLDQEHQTLRYDYGVNLLKSAPRNAVFFAEGDEDYFPVFYLQAVQHQRPDLTLIPAFTLFETWGVEQVERFHPGLGLTASTQTFPDKFARLIYSLSEIVAKNRAKVPCAYSYFNGAFHRYYSPYHPNDLLLKSGALYEIASPALLPTLRLPPPGLRVRNLSDPSNGHESLQGILGVYGTLGLLRP